MVTDMYEVVHMPLKQGHCIMPDVMAGLIINNAVPLCMTNEEETRRHNIYCNWRRLLKHRTGKDYFIGMDSDIKLKSGTIETLKKMLIGCDVAAQMAEPNMHAIWIVKTSVIEKVEIVYAGDRKCPICNWFELIKGAGYKVTFTSKDSLDQLPRLEVRKVSP